MSSESLANDLSIDDEEWTGGSRQTDNQRAIEAGKHPCDLVVMANGRVRIPPGGIHGRDLST